MMPEVPSKSESSRSPTLNPKNVNQIDGIEFDVIDLGSKHLNNTTEIDKYKTGNLKEEKNVLEPSDDHTSDSEKTPTEEYSNKYDEPSSSSHQY